MKTFDLKPQLFDTLKSYNKKNFMSDLMAGIIVGIVDCRSPSHSASPRA